MGRSSAVVALIGPSWDDERNLARLRGPDRDWVREELMVAEQREVPVVPVLVDRHDLPTTGTAVDGILRHPPIMIDSSNVWSVEPELLRRLAVPVDAPSGGRSTTEMIHLAVRAMLRHVLPGPQHAMGNGTSVASVVADWIDDAEWLRYVGIGNIPGRPNGSAVVVLTSTHLGIIQLDARIAEAESWRWPVETVTSAAAVQRRRWGISSVTDLRLCTASGVEIALDGVSTGQAGHLLALMGSAGPSSPGQGRGGS